VIYLPFRQWYTPLFFQSMKRKGVGIEAFVIVDPVFLTFSISSLIECLNVG
jgi:hypothetical protein